MTQPMWFTEELKDPIAGVYAALAAGAQGRADATVYLAGARDALGALAVTLGVADDVRRAVRELEANNGR
jgi:hypothetical protein